ncbi:porin family protein [Photobacterium kasasachensis]|uniref:porin family protein n=1 Tax=Photobacterium TaxID=657 RepID=UPI003D10E144
MKKLAVISTITLASVVAMPAFAADTDWFVGAGVGYQEDSIKGDSAQNGEDATYQLRGGAIINDHHRVMGTYSYMDKSSQNMFLASYDYLVPVAQQINLFAGVSAGVADSKIAGESSSDFVWGGQVGAMYEINDNWSTDLTYRYLDQDYSENNTKIDYSQQVVLSVDYKF